MMTAWTNAQNGDKQATYVNSRREHSYFTCRKLGKFWAAEQTFNDESVYTISAAATSEADAKARCLVFAQMNSEGN